MNQNDLGSELLWADGPPRGAWHSFELDALVTSLANAPKPFCDARS